MSLIVSLRIPDGIVVATDSLATSLDILEIASDIEAECPKCKEKIKLEDIKLPSIGIPISASSFTQKLFSFKEEYAISSCGQGIINNRSIFFHVKQFEKSNEEIDSLEQLVDTLVGYFETQLSQQYSNYKTEAPEDWRPLGFHINGYEAVEDRPVATTYEVYVGRNNIKRKIDSIGCTIGGYQQVVQKLWEIGKGNRKRQFKYPLFSLQDAIDLSEFLITTTSTFQRFSNEVPTVGGDIDIALITPFHKFQWIKKKDLMERLEG